MAITDTDQLGDFVRKKRLETGLSLRAMARLVGIDHTYLIHIESGKVEQPGPKVLLQLARVLEVEPQDLYTLAGYTLTDGLPTFEPYLRAKYDLPDEAVQQLDAYFAFLRQRYGSDERDSDNNDVGRNATKPDDSASGRRL